MTDDEILDRIKALIDEEHALRSAGPPADPAQLSSLEETLDQCWDLLRQRRARREFGDDEDAASVRNADTVEHYQQ